MIRAELNSFNARQTLAVGEKSYTYFSLEAAAKKDLACIASLPFALKVLLENLLRHEDGRTVTKADIEALARWSEDRGKAGQRDRLSAGPSPHARFHRRAGRGRFGGNA